MSLLYILLKQSELNDDITLLHVHNASGICTVTCLNTCNKLARCAIAFFHMLRFRILLMGNCRSVV